MHDSRFNRRALLGKAARLAGSLPFISSILAACIGEDNDEPEPTILPVIDTVTPAPTAPPEPSPTATATLTAVPTGTPSASPTAPVTATSAPTPTPTLVPAEPDLLAGLKELAIPFDTAEPETGFSDLEPLREIVGDSRIVALGEATHGTSEFFKMKHRLTEFLITELGFTIFAIEAPWPATKIVDRYVHGSDATQAEILEGLTFRFWQTQEVLDLIEWMRGYNMRPGVVPVSFQAFDMQVNLTDHAVNQVLAFVEEVDPGTVERFEEYYARLSIGGAPDALAYLLSHRDDYTDTPSTEPYEDIVQTAGMIVQAQEVQAALQSTQPDRRIEGSELRDRYMAENVTWLLDRAGENAKIVLWAHNAHVAATELSGAGGTTQRGMGSHLRERYGDELCVAGFDFFSGTFVAGGSGTGAVASSGRLWVYEILPPPPENVEHIFAQLGLQRFMLNLRSIEAGSPAGDWLLEEHPMWSIGSGYDPVTALHSLRVIVSLPDAFDILIYFHETSATQRLF